MGLMQNEPLVDEKISNIPYVDKFINEFPKFDLLHTASSSTPLAFIIISILCKIIPPTIYFYRMLSVAVSLGCVVVFCKILKELKVYEYTLALLLIFNPYFYRLSFTFYVGLWGMLFGLLAVLFIFRNKSVLNVFLSGLFLTAAVLTQQFYLFLVPAIASVFLIKNKYDLSFRNIFPFSLAFIAPQISYIALFLYWKGLTSLEFQLVHPILLKPQNLIFFFILTGFYFGWILLLNFKFNKKYLFSLVFLPFFFLFLPGYNEELTGKNITGLIMHTSNF